MKKPRISVIIPSFNHEKFVAEAIQSVLDQTYQDFEIVITDDGSTDGTVEEIKKIKDPRIRLFTFETNRGAAFATRNCVANSKGMYLAMLSSDDIFLPDKLEKQVKFLDEHPDIWAVFSYARIIDDNGIYFANAHHGSQGIFKQPNKTRFEWLHYFFYKGNCLCHPSVLARRKVYTELGFPDPRYPQLGDFYRWIKTCLKHEIYILPEELIKFRVHEFNASRSGAKQINRDLFETIKILNYFLEIETTEELLKIFPEATEYGKVEKDILPFFVAMIAINKVVASRTHQIFGLNVLFDMLGSEKIAKKLKSNCGFTHKDFIKLTGQYEDPRVSGLLNSWSWKITAPLRAAVDLFTKIRSS